MTRNGIPIVIEYVSFPESLRKAVKGFSAAQKDKYIIMIDDALSEPEKRETLSHELAHIFEGHFDGETVSGAVEILAHRMAGNIREQHAAGDPTG